MSTSGIESANIVQGSRKRLRGNDAVATTEESGSTPLKMGSIERRIASLSVAQVTKYGTQLLDTLLEAPDPVDGNPLHDNFWQLPDAQEYPDYYEIIKRPLALEEVSNKLEQQAYKSLTDVKHDCETICNNAKRYNVRESPIWIQARELHSLIKITYVQIIESLPEPGQEPVPEAAAPAPTPPRKRITLKSSKSNPKLREDAVVPKAESPALPVPVVTKPQPAPQQPPPQQIIPSTPAQPTAPTPQRYTMPATPGPDEDEGDDDDDDDAYERNYSPGGNSLAKLTKGGLLDGRKRPGKRGKRLKATLRQLFQNLRRMVGSRGYLICQNFDHLPSRREHPDYYQVIHKPISLRDIERKVYDKSYINAYALFMDLEQMLNNAQTYYDQNTDIWRDAQEMHSHFEHEAIPALIQDGFTLEKDDVRQSALPLHLAANSTIEAHKIAFKLIVAKTGNSANGSASPEPSAKGRYSSAGLPASPAAPGSGMAMDGMSHSTPLSMVPPMGTPGMGMQAAPSMSPLPYMPGASPPHGAMGAPASFSDRHVPRPMPAYASPHYVPPIIPPLPEKRVGPGRPRKAEVAARQAHYAAQAAAAAAAAQHQQYEQYGGAMMQPASTPPQWQQAQYLQQQQQQQRLLQQQQYQHAQHQLAQHHTAVAPPPAFQAAESIATPASPVKRKDYLFPAEPPAPLPFEGADQRTPLISHFSVEVQLDTGLESVSTPIVIKNNTATNHTLQVPPTATSVVVEFPLRTLRQPTTSETATADGAEAIAIDDAGKSEEPKPSSKPKAQVYPWLPHLHFNGKQVNGSWTSAFDDEIDPDLLDDDEEEDRSKVSLSHCRVRLHPRRGPNVFDITIKPDPTSGLPLSQLPPERYSLFLC